jgi:hypothetical protein
MSDDIVGTNYILGHSILNQNAIYLVSPIKGIRRIGADNVTDDAVKRSLAAQVDPDTILTSKIAKANRSRTYTPIAANRVVRTATKRDPRAAEVDDLQAPDGVSIGVDFQPIDPITLNAATIQDYACVTGINRNPTLSDVWQGTIIIHRQQKDGGWG